MKKVNLIIFTDLDGTLLDHDTYSFDAATEALDRVKEAGIPLILCSSKTRAEITVWRERLNNKDPFISENGGAIFFPNTFNALGKKYTERDNYQVIELGTYHPELLVHFKTLKNSFGARIRGFSEMGVDEVMRLAGLSRREALLAKQREYSEPFVFTGNEKDKKELERSVKDLNLNLTRGGRFFHLLGDNDKGKAVNIVAEIFKANCSGLKTVALGDSQNDLPMLQVVDVPILVQKSGGLYEEQIDLPNLRRAPGVGPLGWNKAVLRIL
ncbi:MAG: HAD-IIB family hydrolase [Pseudomonadota bacterium]